MLFIVFKEAKTLTTKLFCPYCGRCIGECSSNDESGYCKVLTKSPLKIKKKQMLHSMKCVRCKEPVYISMEFTN